MLPDPASLPTDSAPRDVATETLLSPSLDGSAVPGRQAFEMKFLLPESVARELQSWAMRHLSVDAFADPARDDSYQTTTVYLDTPAFDVLLAAPGFRTRKYRLRRYGDETLVYLERKSRRGDKVKKRRVKVPEAELAFFEQADSMTNWPGEWFRDKILRQCRRPVCRLTYDRSAFVKASDEGPLRLTFDRQVRGVLTSDWAPTPVTDGCLILPGEVICEFKFRDAMPAVFKQLIADMQLQPASVSKYRRMMQALRKVVEPLVTSRS